MGTVCSRSVVQGGQVNLSLHFEPRWPLSLNSNHWPRCKPVMTTPWPAAFQLNTKASISNLQHLLCLASITLCWATGKLIFNLSTYKQEPRLVNKPLKCHMVRAGEANLPIQCLDGQLLKTIMLGVLIMLFNWNSMKLQKFAYFRLFGGESLIQENAEELLLGKCCLFFELKKVVLHLKCLSYFLHGGSHFVLILRRVNSSICTRLLNLPLTGFKWQSLLCTVCVSSCHFILNFSH